MHDMDRATLTRAVYGKLSDARFRRRLTAADGEGMRPVIVALPDDSVADLLREVRQAGGAANVAYPMLNGLFVLAVRVNAESQEREAEPSTAAHCDPLLRSDCTVAVLVERLKLDMSASVADVTYRFVVEDDDDTERSASAAVVAVAG